MRAFAASEVRLAETRNALIMPRRIKDRQVEIQRLADPMAEQRMVRQIVVGQRMDEGPQARRFNHGNDVLERMLEEVDLILGDKVGQTPKSIILPTNRISGADPDPMQAMNRSRSPFAAGRCSSE
jgi:hypothetical protein